MRQKQETFSHLCARLQESGLRILHSGPPAGDWPGDPRVRSILLVGQAGSELWPHFTQSPEYHDGAPNPLDRWSQRVIQAAAPQYRFFHPSGGPPYAPIHALVSSGAYSNSPLGILVHATFGLWTAFRGILVTEELLPPSPCLPAPDPQVFAECYGACPAGALTQTGYDAQACGLYMAQTPQAPCWAGCRARHACTLGQAYAYSPAHARFHAAAYVRGVQRTSTAAAT